jgi:hypothetical protein
VRIVVSPYVSSGETSQATSARWQGELQDVCHSQSARPDRQTCGIFRDFLKVSKVRVGRLDRLLSPHQETMASFDPVEEE